MSELVSKSDVLDHPLPPFDITSVCPKCGHDDVSTYHKSGCTCDRERSSCEAEHLARTCQRCRFQWAEAVIS